VRRKTAETDPEPAGKTVTEKPAATTPNKTSAIASVLQTPPEAPVAEHAPVVSKQPATVVDSQIELVADSSPSKTADSTASKSAVTSAATKPEPLPPALPVVNSAELLQQQAEAANALVEQELTIVESNSVDRDAAS